MLQLRIGDMYPCMPRNIHKLQRYSSVCLKDGGILE